MSGVELFELVLLLMALVIPLELGARRVGLPPAGALILGGMALTMMPGRHDVVLDPDLVLVLFLPPLLLAGAFYTVWRDFWDNLRIILQLAVGAVLFTTLAVGVVTHLVAPSLPWAACFTLGAIVSPPDAVAAKAVLQRVVLPRRMLLLLESESLVNDATGLVLFRMAVAAALTGTFSAGHAVVSFGVLAAGGVATGVAIGWIASLLVARLRDVHLAVVASLLVAWASYIAGERIGVSGVLSTVTSGLVLGWRQHEGLSAMTRMHAEAVWEVTTFVLESLIFVLIGLSLRGVLERFGNISGMMAHLLPAMTAVVGAVVVSRFLWIFGAIYLPRLVWPGMRRTTTRLPVAIPLIMSWAGMRGVVSLAAALALPDGMPGRDFILVASFVVILVTVLVQGATLAPLIRLLRLEALPMSGRMTEAAARAEIARVQLAVVTRLAKDSDGTLRHPRLLDSYEYRARAAQRYSETENELMSARREHFGVILSAIDAGRAELLRLFRSGNIQHEVLRLLERELDLEEMSTRRLSGESLR